MFNIGFIDVKALWVRTRLKVAKNRAQEQITVIGMKMVGRICVHRWHASINAEGVPPRSAFGRGRMITVIGMKMVGLEGLEPSTDRL